MKKANLYSILLFVLILTLSFSAITCSKTSEGDIKTGTISTSPSALVVGDKAPDFTLQTLNGGTVNLSDFKGKIVMINVWWSDCEGCVEEAPYIQKAFTKISSDNPEWAILTINTWDTPTSLRKFTENKKLTFPVLIDPDKKLDQRYLKYGVPTTFFVDANGIIGEIRHEIFGSPDEIEVTFTNLQRHNLQ